MRRFLLSLATAALIRGAAILGSAAILGAAGCSLGDSVERGCKTRQDCPQPDLQVCQVETGVCVGFTSPGGQVDGGDHEGEDAGADAS